MRFYCAPDLPFWQTLTWYLKQIGSMTIIALGTIILIGIAAIILDKMKVIKL